MNLLDTLKFAIAALWVATNDYEATEEIPALTTWERKILDSATESTYIDDEKKHKDYLYHILHILRDMKNCEGVEEVIATIKATNHYKFP
jgi:hypothetical protein